MINCHLKLFLFEGVHVVWIKKDEVTQNSANCATLFHSSTDSGYKGGHDFPNPRFD